MTIAPPTTVLIADDHAATRGALRMLLDGETGLEVVAEAEDLAGVLHFVLQHRPRLAKAIRAISGGAGYLAPNGGSCRRSR
jgi:DNA-binding NarL/FixJ family response regulator